MATALPSTALEISGKVAPSEVSELSKAIKDMKTQWALSPGHFVISAQKFGDDMTFKAYLNHSNEPILTFAPAIPLTPLPDLSDTAIYPEALEIQVTQADIDQGMRRSAQDCAIARAVARRFDGVREIQVGGNGFSVQTTDGRCIAYMAVEAYATSRFVQHFDHGFPVAPETFQYRRMT